MSKTMLINVVEPEESRIAIVEDNVLEELYVERTSKGQIVGNIYKGKVINVEPSIEAAFVDIGLKRNGFLHVSDVMPNIGKTTNRRRRVVTRKKSPGGNGRIQSYLRPGQEVLVQVTKVGIGDKGPTLTTYISLPGRYLVLMPESDHYGISKKIDEEEERKRLKKIIADLHPPKNMGLIVRTAGADQTKKELSKDFHYLSKLWKATLNRSGKVNAPAVIYQESELVIRTIRDIFTADIDEITVDSPVVYEKAKDFLHLIMPKCEKRVKLYEGSEPLFHKNNIEVEIEKINVKKVPLLCGGSIVIEQTEALVAVDVNSGKYREEKDPEETAFKTNLEASEEIVRQIRLRDLGGVIIIDFIDMREESHNHAVEKVLFDALKRDRARTKVLKMSKFGIIEMTRQRVRASLKDVLYEPCKYCWGTGFLKTAESVSLNVIRKIKAVINYPEINKIEVVTCPEVAFLLQNQKRKRLAELESAFNKEIIITQQDDYNAGDAEVKYFKDGGQRVNI
ncbi:MAG: Rne/Rng family ribonuclease [Planctomycetes bacterium]|nr:Rne/Rng family ribonuclease [Planctomycetota bacterium]MBI4008387.1 Rne/Rng family ribonuclease [Planctomycetota bacterium]